MKITKGAIIMLLTKKLFNNPKKNVRSTENRKSGSAVLPIKVDGKVVFFA